MRYLPELYYFEEQEDFPFRQAVLATATAVSQWCSHFYARVIVPLTKDTDPLEKGGLLPVDPQERQSFVADLVDWLFDNSAVDGLFCLFLDDEPAPQSGKTAKFDHHDDTCCWALNLMPDEFAHLQTTWKANGLPEDLFYPEHDGLCVPYPGTGLKARLLRALGVQRCYTPKQWENENQKRPA